MTNTTQHTPAPWHMGKAGYDKAIYDKNGAHIATMPDMLQHDEVLANARLIAAAPELLEALKALSGLEVKGHALIDRLQFSETGRALAGKIAEAIAKAEGK